VSSSSFLVCVTTRVMSILSLAIVTVFPASAADEDAFFAGPSTMDQPSAEAYCVDNGGHLASINSQTELDAAAAVCSASAGDAQCWIGLELDAEGGNSGWSWTDGSALDFGFNSDGTPTHSIHPWSNHAPEGGGEECVRIVNLASDPTINDLGCNSQFIPLCEKSNDADCASIPIDAYLTTCSDEFAANELDIESLQSAQSEVTERLDAAETDISANSERIDGLADASDVVEGTLQSVQSDLDEVKADITANDGRMDALESAADARDDTVDSVQSDLEALESRLAEVESWKETVLTFSSAQASPGIADAVGAYGSVASADSKDTIITVLVVANVVLIIGCFVAAFAACFGTHRQTGYGKVFPAEN